MGLCSFCFHRVLRVVTCCNSWVFDGLKVGLCGFMIVFFSLMVYDGLPFFFVIAWVFVGWVSTVLVCGVGSFFGGMIYSE